MFWDSLQDANMRLSDTVVVHEGLPVYVRRINEEGVVTASRLDEPEEMFQFYYTRESIDTRPVALGYCKVRENWIYYMRTPARRHKQGLAIGAMKCILPDGSHSRLRSPSPDLQELHKTITNQFPDFLQALSQAKNGQSSAFHRQWMLRYTRRGDIEVHYRGHKVGSIIEDEVVLDDNRGYLREHLQECIA